MRGRSATSEWDDPSRVSTRVEVVTIPQIRPAVRRAMLFVLSSLGAAMLVVAVYGWLAT